MSTLLYTATLPKPNPSKSINDVTVMRIIGNPAHETVEITILKSSLKVELK